MWEVFRRGFDTWLSMFSGLQTFAIADDNDFITFPINANSQSVETNRQNPFAVATVVRGISINVRGNSLGMDCEIELRNNTVNTGKIITITAGVNAIMSEITTPINYAQLDLESAIIRFDDAGEAGAWSTRGSTIGGGRG